MRVGQWFLWSDAGPLVEEEEEARNINSGSGTLPGFVPRVRDRSNPCPTLHLHTPSRRPFQTCSFLVPPVSMSDLGSGELRMLD